MSEIKALLRLFDEATCSGARMALATVVRVRGSAYRRPGAKMLITGEGRTAGLVSGGCLERTIARQADRVMTTGKCELLTYDTRLRFGCQGSIDVLVEPIPEDGSPHWCQTAKAVRARRKPARIATVLTADPVSPADQANEANGVAARHAAFFKEEADYDPRLPDWLVGELHVRARAELADARCDWERIAGVAGQADVFWEDLLPPISLVVFGSGVDSRCVIHFANELGWHVTVIDAQATRPRAVLPPVDDFIALPWQMALGRIELTARTAAVLMTHNFASDVQVLGELLPSKVGYVGILGPRARTARLLDEVEARTEPVTGTHLKRLHAPIGLDLGGETPEEVAIAIIAEIQAVFANRSAGFLKDSSGPIHGKSHRSDGHLSPVAGR